LKFFEGGSYQ